MKSNWSKNEIENDFNQIFEVYKYFDTNSKKIKMSIPQ